MTYREALRKLINDLDEWNVRVYGLNAKTDKQTKKNINKWLNELLPIFFNGVLQVNASLSFEKIKSTLGTVGGSISAGDFVKEYFNRVRRLSVRDYNEATVLRNSLAKRFGKNYKQFYREWDLMVQNYQSKPFREIVKKFEKKAVAESIKFQTFDKNGNVKRNYTAKSYGSMYARTRASEVSNVLQQQEMDELGLDVVRITDANTITPICTLFENKYFSLHGKTKGLPKLEVYPPFHPNCRHIMTAVKQSGVREYIEFNRRLDKEIKAKQAQWTDSQRRAVQRQMAYLKSNQAVK